MKKATLFAPLLLSACLSTEATNHYVDAMRGDLSNDGAVTVADAKGVTCRFTIKGSQVSPAVCSDGKQGSVHLISTGEGYWTGRIKYTNGWNVQVIVDQPIIAKRSQVYSPPVTRRKRQTSRTYYRGPRGGCYYINGNGNKTYVDRGLCS